MPNRKIQLHLPFLQDYERSAPAGLLRSALFRVTSKKQTPVFDETLASWKGWEINYSGPPLSQTDLDVWMEILDVSENLTELTLTTRGLLKRLKRSTGGHDVDWLIKSIKRLAAATLHIKIDGFGTYNGSLLERALVPEDTNRFIKLELNGDLTGLFRDNKYTILLPEERKKLKGDLAKWMYGYVKSHRATDRRPSEISLSLLKDLCGSTRDDRYYFKTTVKKAMEQLKTIRVIIDYDFVGEKKQILQFYKEIETSNSYIKKLENLIN